MSDGYDNLYKLLLIGDAGTGKSCLLMRYTDDTFTESYISTIGVDFKVRSLNSNCGKVCKLQIWDTAGQERFRTITSSYYRGAHGILVVFDVSDRSSFENLSKWLGEIGRLAAPGVHVIIVANKCDLSNRQVSREEIANFCSNNGNLPFFEVSAKNNSGIHDAFQTLTETLVNNVPSFSQACGIKPVEDCPQFNEFQQQPQPQNLEEYINLSTMLLSTKVLPSEQNQMKPQLSEFQKKVAHKPTSWKLGLTVGEFEQPKSSLTVRYKTDSEASAIAYELGLESTSVALAVSFKATDDAESFRLGELSSTIKGLLEPLLNTSKTTFTTNVVNEFDGTKIFRMLFEIKDAGLYDVLRQIMTVSETSKFEIDLEFSERPCKNAPPEFCFARLKLDTEFKRVFHSFGGKDLTSLLKLGSDSWIFMSFFSALKKCAFELEFDSWAEFWTEIVCKGDGEVPPFLEKVGWHSAETGIQHFLFGHQLASDTRELFYAIYKDLECLAGLHGVQLVFGNQHVLDIKGDNLDLFTLLPSLSALQEAQNSLRSM